MTSKGPRWWWWWWSWGVPRTFHAGTIKIFKKASNLASSKKDEEMKMSW
jgi:hypothetical protein